MENNKEKISSSVAELKRIRFFQKNVRQKKGTYSSQKHFYEHDSFITTIAAAFIFVINILWLFYNKIFTSLPSQHAVITLISVIAMNTASLFILIINAKFQKRFQKQTSIIYLLFYVVIILGCMGQTVTENIQIYQNIPEHIDFISKFIGVSIFCSYLFLISIAPLHRKRMGIIVLAVLLLSILFPLFVDGKEVYQKIFVSQFIIALAVTLIYITAYLVIKKSAILTEKTDEIAYTDFLTKCLNRRCLDYFWENAKANPKYETMGMIMFDIDNFKSYNDNYSHEKGDEVLQSITELIYNVIDEDNDFLFRYGGEEFVVMIPNCDKNKLINKAAQLRYIVMNKNIARNDGTAYPFVTITCGAALVKSSDDYISICDKQLYIGKNGTKNCVVYEDEVVVS